MILLGNTIIKKHTIILNTETYSIIEDVRNDIDSRNQVIAMIYSDEKLLGSVSSFVLKNGGQSTDIHDIFLFGIMAFIKQCYRPEFSLSTNINSYVFSVIRYEWIRRKRQESKMIFEDRDYLDESNVSIEHLLIDKERRVELNIALNKLDDKCKSVLKKWASNIRMREIALALDYKSEGMARKKKHECLNKLRSLIKDIK